MPCPATLPLGLTIFTRSGELSVLGLIPGTLQLLRGLGSAFFRFSLGVSGRLKRLNRFAEAHAALGASTSRGRFGVRWRCARHVVLQAAKADPKIFADVGRSHALAEVLKSRAGFVGGHPSQRLNFVADGRILFQHVSDTRLVG